MNASCEAFAIERTCSRDVAGTSHTTLLVEGEMVLIVFSGILRSGLADLEVEIE